METKSNSILLTDRSDLGKNLSLLPSRLNKAIPILSSVTIDSILTFRLNTIENLYSFDLLTNSFKLEHQDGDFLARATATLNPLGVRFKVEYSDSLFTEYGLSYVGIIRVYHMNGIFNIKLPGEMSYDPASPPGDSVWVDFYQVSKIVILLGVLIRAALLGATKKFLKRIFVVLKPIISRYYFKEDLFRWMYKQVKFSCIYKKQPVSYAFYLQNIEKRYSGTVQNYLAMLEMLKRGDIQEILPPPEYFKGINEEKSSEHSSKVKLGDTFSMKMLSSDVSDESSMPTVKEIAEGLWKMKEKYESELSRAFESISELEQKKHIFPDFRVSVNSKFTDRCPIF